MRSTFLCVVAALAGAGLAINQGSTRPEAGTAIRLDIGQLIDRADLVLSASVLDAVPIDLDGQVHTDYLLGIEATYWGEDQDLRTVRLPGGVLPSGRGTLVPGMPSLVPGSEVLLVLTDPDSEQRRVVVGLNQGHWRIVRDSQGRRFAVRTGEGVALVTSGDGSTIPADRMDVMEYADLVAQIEAAVGNRRARGGDSEGK